MKPILVYLWGIVLVILFGAAPMVLCLIAVEVIVVLIWKFFGFPTHWERSHAEVRRLRDREAQKLGYKNEKDLIEKVTIFSRTYDKFIEKADKWTRYY